MKYLLLMIIGTGVAYGQSFNANIYDVNTGRTKYIYGEIDSNPEPFKLENELRRLSEKVRRRVDSMRQNRQAIEEMDELRRQTYYLRRIAEKK